MSKPETLSLNQNGWPRILAVNLFTAERITELDMNT